LLIVFPSQKPAEIGLLILYREAGGISRVAGSGYYNVVGDRNKDFLELERGAGMRCSSVPQILPLKREKWNKMTIIPVGLYP
jgi:hypothetical protein